MTNTYAVRLARPLEFDEVGEDGVAETPFGKVYLKAHAPTYEMPWHYSSELIGKWSTPFRNDRDKAIQDANDEYERLYREGLKPEVIEAVELAIEEGRETAFRRSMIKDWQPHDENDRKALRVLTAFDETAMRGEA